MANKISDAQYALAIRLGESAAPTTTTELTKRRSWLVDGIKYLCSDKEWWFLWATDSSLDTVADQGTYNFPTGFFSIKRIKVDGYRYKKVPFDEVYERFEIPSNPPVLLPSLMARAYYVEGDTFTLIPTPGAPGVNNIEVKGYKRPTYPTDENGSIIIPDEYQDAIVSYAEFRFWSTAHRRGKASDAEAEFRDHLARMDKENIRRKFGEI